MIRGRESLVLILHSLWMSTLAMLLLSGCASAASITPTLTPKNIPKPAPSATPMSETAAAVATISAKPAVGPGNFWGIMAPAGVDLGMSPEEALGKSSVLARVYGMGSGADAGKEVVQKVAGATVVKKTADTREVAMVATDHMVRGTNTAKPRMEICAPKVGICSSVGETVVTDVIAATSRMAPHQKDLVVIKAKVTKELFNEVREAKIDERPISVGEKEVVAGYAEVVMPDGRIVVAAIVNVITVGTAPGVQVVDTGREEIVYTDTQSVTAKDGGVLAVPGSSGSKIGKGDSIRGMLISGHPPKIGSPGMMTFLGTESPGVRPLSQLIGP